MTERGLTAVTMRQAQVAALLWAAEHIGAKATSPGVPLPAEAGQDLYSYARAAFRGDETQLRFWATQVADGNVTIPLTETEAERAAWIADDAAQTRRADR